MAELSTPRPGDKCLHLWEQTGGAASADCLAIFERCSRCGERRTIETPRDLGLAAHEAAQRPELTALERADIRRELEAREESLELDAKIFRLTRRQYHALELSARAARVRELIALLGVLCLALAGCSLSHGRIEGLPLYVHLCDAMPAADQDAWGEAAGAINAELEGPAVWVGHGPPRGCSTVDVCPSREVAAPETRIGTCVVTVRYAPGTAREATQELELLLGRLP